MLSTLLDPFRLFLTFPFKSTNPKIFNLYIQVVYVGGKRNINICKNWCFLLYKRYSSNDGVTLIE